MKWLFIIACVICLLWTLADGSILDFASSPSTIKPSFTRTLNLTCSVTNTNTTTPAKPTGGAIVGRRDILQSNDDINHLMSLVVTRNGKDVAIVTPYDTAKTYVADTNLVVTENVHGNHEGEGYIQMLWSDPTDAQTGRYQCKANGISSDGHYVTLFENVDVNLTTTSHDDLVKRFYDLESKVIVMDTEKEALQAQVLQLEQENAHLKLEIESLNDTLLLEIAAGDTKLQQDMQDGDTKLQHDMQDGDTKLQQEITTKTDAILETLRDVQHVEMGNVSTNATDSDGSPWQHVGSYDTTEVTGYFTTPYKTAPLVFLSVSEFNNHHIDYDSGHGNSFQSSSFLVDLVDVNERSFTVRFRKEHRSGNYVALLTANWLSVSQ